MLCLKLTVTGSWLTGPAYVSSVDGDGTERAAGTGRRGGVDLQRLRQREGCR